jgi:hypothetical protein
MITYHACSKCDAPVRRSRRRNALEFVLGLVMLPYRCTVCDRREMKLRFIDMEPPPLSEQEENQIIPPPTERELEEARKAEQKGVAKAAKKAAERLKKQEQEKAKSGKKKGEPEPTPVSIPQSHTSDEEGEQISPS